ncbi:MAG: carboxypeptidase-like regulatory domain-containing protein [Candidatus Dojkabacteria bacterium]|nr:carboxypeptidase-like regulatory domain-containing protein [Candidatus Dojkabacteria bacterium]
MSSGFIYSLYALIKSPVLSNYFFTIGYLIFTVLNILGYIFKHKHKAGIVLDESGEPIKGAIIRLFQGPDQVLLAMSNANGELKENIESGEYSILVYKEGFIKISNYLINVTEGGQLGENIVLEKQELN